VPHGDIDHDVHTVFHSSADDQAQELTAIDECVLYYIKMPTFSSGRHMNYIANKER
jgi:hypothetical protein